MCIQFLFSYRLSYRLIIQPTISMHFLHDLSCGHDECLNSDEFSLSESNQLDRTGLYSNRSERYSSQQLSEWTLWTENSLCPTSPVSNDLVNQQEPSSTRIPLFMTAINSQMKLQYLPLIIQLNRKKRNAESFKLTVWKNRFTKNSQAFHQKHPM